jgi:hypothetical protein
MVARKAAYAVIGPDHQRRLIAFVVKGLAGIKDVFGAQFQTVTAALTGDKVQGNFKAFNHGYLRPFPWLARER